MIYRKHERRSYCRSVYSTAACTAHGFTIQDGMETYKYLFAAAGHPATDTFARMDRSCAPRRDMPGTDVTDRRILTILGTD